MTNRCDECAYWVQEETRDVVELGECKRVAKLQDATKFIFPYNSQMHNYIEITTQYADRMMFVAEYYGNGGVYLHTKPQFFCAHFEAKK